MKVSVLFLSLAFITLSAVHADESFQAKTRETGKDMGRAAKKTGREIKDKTCELVNGKMECGVQKMEDSVKNGADKVEDKID